MQCVWNADGPASSVESSKVLKARRETASCTSNALSTEYCQPAQANAQQASALAAAQAAFANETLAEATVDTALNAGELFMEEQ